MLKAHKVCLKIKRSHECIRVFAHRDKEIDMGLTPLKVDLWFNIIAKLYFCLLLIDIYFHQFIDSCQNLPNWCVCIHDAMFEWMGINTEPKKTYYTMYT